MELVEDIYSASSKFPKEEIYGLTSQMKRAAVSIVSNLAEGAARKGAREKIQFYCISRGSLSELDAQLEICLRLRFIEKDDYEKIQYKVDEIGRMLWGLIKNYENV